MKKLPIKNSVIIQRLKNHLKGQDIKNSVIVQRFKTHLKGQDIKILVSDIPKIINTFNNDYTRDQYSKGNLLEREV